MHDSIDEMRSLLRNYLPTEGIQKTGIDGLVIFRRDVPYKKRPQLYHPQIIMLAQGKKNIYLGKEMFVYDPSRYFVQTVPLPVVCEAVIEHEQPMLGLVIAVDPKIIGEILFKMESHASIPPKVSTGVYDAPVTDEMRDSAVRLLRSLADDDEKSILGPLYLKELLFLILKNEKGEILRELAVSNRGVYQIARVIREIHEHYNMPLEISRLAKEAGMSSSGFHTAFRSVTSTSPLQYIKHIRLHKAREIIQREGEKANTAAARVGYESVSQFSREYKRTFGVSPSRDRLPVSAF